MNWLDVLEGLLVLWWLLASVSLILKALARWDDSDEGRRQGAWLVLGIASLLVWLAVILPKGVPA